MKFRVCYRQTAARPWQIKDCADRAEAVAFQRAMRRQLYAAFIQIWYPALEDWIG